MNEEEFDNLMDQVNEWVQGRYRPADEPMYLNAELSNLTPEQWIRLQESMSGQVPTLSLEEGKTIKFSPEAWKSLGNMLKQSDIKKLILSKESICEYSDLQWNSLFSGIGNSLVSIGFSFSHFNKMKSKSLTCFFQEIRKTAIKELDLSYEHLGEASREVCEKFFNEFILCTQIKRLILAGDFAIGASGSMFWEVCATSIPKSVVEHLNFDSTALHRVQENDWVNFCQSINGSSVTSLSLQDNNFYRFNAEQWGWFFKGLSLSSVNELDIHEDHSLELKEAKWENFCEGLRSTSITKLHYESDQFNVVQKIVVLEILKENQKKVLLKESLQDGNSRSVLPMYKLKSEGVQVEESHKENLEFLPDSVPSSKMLATQKEFF